jgi:hypothetical protein
MSIEQNFDVSDDWHIGEDKVLQFTVRDKLGVVVNITGWTITWALRADPEPSSPVLITKSVGTGIVITNGAGGIFEVTVAAGDYTLVTGPDKYYHSGRRTGAGSVAQLVYGYAILLPM